MENLNFQEQLENLVKSDDLISIGREVNALKVQFEDFILEAERVQQVNQLEAQERGETYEPIDYKSQKESFYNLYKSFQESRKKQIEIKSALENENLKQKRALINRLKEVIEAEENIGSAFNSYKEIHETWKKIGDIAREKRDETQKEYSRLLEIFFYNIKIYRELKDHDYKRNFQLKEDVIFRLKQLRTKNLPIREFEASLRSLQDEWEEIGPVNNEDWESLKKSYWDSVKTIYEKINAHYEEQRNVLLDNLNKKKVLIETLKSVVSDLSNIEKGKDWEAKTNEIIALQEQWKQIGFGPKKENDAVWKEFRSLCDSFFEAKKNFNKYLDNTFKEVADKKRALIAEVQEINSSTDWKKTADRIVFLQKKWKETGSAGPRYENKLWSEFRAACDVFYNSRDKHFEEQETELVGNLEQKLALITEIENHKVSEDKTTALSDLKNFNDRFSAIGHVPTKNKNEVFSSFKKAMDDKYASLKLEAKEKDMILYKAKVETMLASPDRGKLLNQERFELKKQMDVLNKEIIQMETNLSFFARSKGADQLRKDVEKKIELAEEKITGLKRKLSSLPNE
ncbi:MAG: DUF349 domain-containing protein [Bacteroidetes bacterium]|nr:DUF349 domain-containing protein [Bacteroidota bacterium]